VREARGEFIAFTDDDCLPEPALLETLLRAARDRPNALVGGTTVNGLTGDFFASTSQLIVDLVYEHFNADPDDGYFLTSNNVLCSRERFLELGGFDESFPRAGAEDRDFCDRWRMRGWPIVWRPEARVEHRHGQSFRQFVDLYVRYGRGAYRYQAIRKKRGSGTMREDLGFHRTLPRRVWRRRGHEGDAEQGGDERAEERGHVDGHGWPFMKRGADGKRTVCKPQAMISRATVPWTSVSRKSRPA
jgi:GT2 family glycosyltransferase